MLSTPVCELPVNTQLGRRKGRLVNVSHFFRDGVGWYVCRCDCGGTKEVKLRYFNSNALSACDSCRARGIKPDIRRTQLRRVHFRMNDGQMAILGADVAPKCPQNVEDVGLTLDPLVHATLGVEVEMESNRTAKLPRAILADYSEVVRVATGLVDLKEEQWESLRQALKQDRDLLNSHYCPRTKVCALEQRAGVSLNLPKEIAPAMMMSVAILAALRWGLDHPNQPDWWTLDARTID